MQNIENPEKFEREGFRIYRALDAILNRVEYSPLIENFRFYFLDCIDPNTPSYKRNLVKLIRMHFDNTQKDIVDEDLNKFIKLRNDAETWLKSVGYRYGTHTGQEARLVAGTIKDEYSKDPYKPTGLIDGYSSLEEIHKARNLERCFGASIGLNHFYELLEGFNIKIVRGYSLEPLDKEGNTIKDPRLLDQDFNEIPGLKKTNKFPFRRD